MKTYIQRTVSDGRYIYTFFIDDKPVSKHETYGAAERALFAVTVPNRPPRPPIESVRVQPD